MENELFQDIQDVGKLDDDNSHIWVIWRGVKYMKGYAVWVKTDEETALPIFGVIHHITVINSCVKFIVLLYMTRVFR